MACTIVRPHLCNITMWSMHEGKLANLRALRELGDRLRIEFFAMHGTLLGWTFNQETLPWDEDLDFSFDGVHHPALLRFAHAHSGKQLLENNSVSFFEMPGPRNHIEFRVQHVPTRVYTDITSLRATDNQTVLQWKVNSSPTNKTPPMLVMKSSFNSLKRGHQYRVDDVFPLAPCAIHGEPLHCPRSPHNVLLQEYPHYLRPLYQPPKGQSGQLKWRYERGCWHEVQHTSTRRGWGGRRS